MDNRKLYIAIGILIISVGLGGCNNADNGSAVSVFSNAVQQIEIPEPEPDPVEQNEPVEGNEDTEEDIVDDTPLTQEEIDELKKNATDNQKIGFEAYEALSKGESYTDSYGCDIKEVVGKPGDTSWRQMTDEEAQAALEKNPNDIIADGELKAGTWNKFYDGKIYFNPYEYYDAMRARVESAPDVIHDFE